jgi:hypothetical protein
MFYFHDITAGNSMAGAAASPSACAGNSMAGATVFTLGMHGLLDGRRYGFHPRHAWATRCAVVSLLTFVGNSMSGAVVSPLRNQAFLVHIIKGNAEVKGGKGMGEGGGKGGGKGGQGKGGMGEGGLGEGKGPGTLAETAFRRA